MVEQEQEIAVVANPMSISHIAPRQMTPPIPPPPPSSSTTKTDTAFIRSMWRLAELTQRTICAPRALAQPICNSQRQKTQLLTAYHSLYSSFPAPLSDTRAQFFTNLVGTSPRISRQSLFLRSNYWHCIMTIQADVNEAAGVQCDVRGAIEAGRIAMRAFFDFWEYLRSDASVWWVFQHRAFEQAVSSHFHTPVTPQITNLIISSQYQPFLPHCFPVMLVLSQMHRPSWIPSTLKLEMMFDERSIFWNK